MVPRRGAEHAREETAVTPGPAVRVEHALSLEYASRNPKPSLREVKDMLPQGFLPAGDAELAWFLDPAHADHPEAAAYKTEADGVRFVFFGAPCLEYGKEAVKTLFWDKRARAFKDSSLLLDGKYWNKAGRIVLKS
jgi:hypothetical protein